MNGWKWGHNYDFKTLKFEIEIVKKAVTKSKLRHYNNYEKKVWIRH